MYYSPLMVPHCNYSAAKSASRTGIFYSTKCIFFSSSFFFLFACMPNNPKPESTIFMGKFAVKNISGEIHLEHTRLPFELRTWISLLFFSSDGGLYVRYFSVCSFCLRFIACSQRNWIIIWVTFWFWCCCYCRHMEPLWGWVLSVVDFFFFSYKGVHIRLLQMSKSCKDYCF